MRSSCSNDGGGRPTRPRTSGSHPELTDPAMRVVRTSAGRLLRVSFPSGWQPDPEEPGADRWTAVAANQRARAHVLEHGDVRGRPWVVLVHGTGMGYPEADVRSLGANHFFRELGCNVVMPILAMHGSRRDRRKAISFPGLDVLDDVHGLAQSAWDVRRIISWIRATREPTGVAVAGISLGGYVAALVAGLETPLSCVVCMVPASDFPALLRRHVRRSLREQRRVRGVPRAIRGPAPLGLPVGVGTGHAGLPSLHRGGHRRPPHRPRRAGRSAVAPLG